MAGEDEKLRKDATTVLGHMERWLVSPNALKENHSAMLAYTKLEVEVLAQVTRKWLESRNGNQSRDPGESPILPQQGG